MSGHKLAAYVYVDGAGYGPDDTVPDDVAQLITNPAAWETPPEEPGEEPASLTDTAPTQEGGLAVPPKGGTGSGLEAWARYGESLGLDMSGAKTRDDAIALVEAAGKPTEAAAS